MAAVVVASEAVVEDTDVVVTRHGEDIAAVVIEGVDGVMRRTEDDMGRII